MPKRYDCVEIFNLLYGVYMQHSMKHRHIDTQDYILPAIDDIIIRGNRNDWVELRDAALADPSIKQKILDICKYYSYEKHPAL